MNQDNSNAAEVRFFDSACTFFSAATVVLAIMGLAAYKMNLHPEAAYAIVGSVFTLALSWISHKVAGN